MREYRARDMAKSAAVIQNEQEDENGRNRHQRSLKDIIVYPCQNSSRCGVGQGYSHPDPDAPTESDAKDGIDDDAHGEGVGRHVADDSDEHGDSSETLSCR